MKPFPTSFEPCYCCHGGCFAQTHGRNTQVVSAQRKHQDTWEDKVLDLQFYYNLISG